LLQGYRGERAGGIHRLFLPENAASGRGDPIRSPDDPLPVPANRESHFPGFRPAGEKRESRFPGLLWRERIGKTSFPVRSGGQKTGKAIFPIFSGAQETGKAPFPIASETDGISRERERIAREAERVLWTWERIAVGTPALRCRVKLAGEVGGECGDCLAAIVQPFSGSVDPRAGAYRLF